MKFLFSLIVFVFFSSNAFAKNIQIIRDSEIEFFLQSLINNFTSSEDSKDFSIKPLIVIDNSMNAFVTGNDYIYIHTGLLENLDSFEEIEGILAHEIGHLKLGHVESRKILSKKNSNLANIAVFALLGSSLAGSNNNINGSILLGTDFFYKKQFKYNRTQELEADIFSVKALNKLKKSSIGLNHFFKKIEEKNKLFPNKNNYYASHPNSENRLEIINSLSNVKDNNLNTEINYYDLKLNLQKLKIKLTAYTKNKQKLDIIKKNLKEKNKIFYSSIKSYLNHDIKSSIIKALELQEQNKTNPFTNEMIGNLFFIKGNYEKASTNYSQAIEKFNKLNISIPPNIKLSLAKSLIEINDEKSLKKSLLILEELMPIKYNSTYFWKLVGMTANRLGNKPASLVAIAEEKIIKKQYDKAKLFASKALKYKNIKTLYKIRASDIINLK